MVSKHSLVFEHDSTVICRLRPFLSAPRSTSQPTAVRQGSAGHYHNCPKTDHLSNTVDAALMTEYAPSSSMSGGRQMVLEESEKPPVMSISTFQPQAPGMFGPCWELG